MKKLLLLVATFAMTTLSYAQVVVAGVSPASIQGDYDFGIQADYGWPSYTGNVTDPPNQENWNLALDFSIPGTFVQAEVALAEDGTPGVNPQGIDSTYEGCSALTNAASVNGKIALIYRNSCDFASKVYNAQVAGAVAAIIINRSTETNQTNIIMTASTTGDGPNCTIPAVMVSSATGEIIVNELQNGPVVMFIGNKLGAFQNDASISRDATLIPTKSGVLNQLASNATEFNFDLGTRIYNDGIQDQGSISLNASVDGPTGNVYSETVSGISVLAGDSVDVYPGGAYSLPQFGLASYPDGRYTLTYTVDLGVADDFSSDNVRQVDFVVQDSIYTLAEMDPTTNQPVSSAGYRPSTNTTSFSNCIVFDDPNGSRVTVEGLYFSASSGTDPVTGTQLDLTGEEIGLYVYRWEDVFTDLNDANLAFNVLNPVGVGYYYYTADDQSETVYGQLGSPVTLEDNQRFLFCTQTFNQNVYLGFDAVRNYLWNEAYYLQPIGPVENDGQYFASGFGMENVPAIGAKMGTVGVSELATVDGIAFPNPATNVVTINIEATGNATLTVTDIAGRTAMTTNVGLANGTAEVNIEALESGVYVFNVAFEDGRTSQFNVVKK